MSGSGKPQSFLDWLMTSQVSLVHREPSPWAQLCSIAAATYAGLSLFVAHDAQKATLWLVIAIWWTR